MGIDDELGVAPRERSVWRRVVEIGVPVVVLAVAAPFVVNGLAAAVNETVPDTTAVEVMTSTIAADPTTTVAVETSVSDSADATRISIDGLDDEADDRTISLATEIVPTAGASTAGASTAGESAAGSGSRSVTTTTAAGVGSTGEAGESGEAGEAEHSHGDVAAEIALTRAERETLGGELAVARGAAEQFATVAAAEAGGYTLVTGYLPLIGAHYIKWGLMDGVFDPGAPEMLLYDGTEPDSSIVGSSYYLFSETEPSPFSGGNDHWHQHIGLCIKDGVVVGGSATTPEQCAARGGAKAGAENGWMVHAWVVPGWDSPQGVFSPEHPGLTPELPTS